MLLAPQFPLPFLRVDSDTQVFTSESGYGSSKPFWNSTRKKGNGNWGANSNYKFLGFIYNPAVKEESKTIDQIADEVIAGKWGNGDARKKALANAGYNYSEVQAKVNQKLAGNTSSTTYIVNSGDTLSAIARSCSRCFSRCCSSSWFSCFLSC